MFYLIHRDQTNIKNYVPVYWSGQINGNFVYTEYAGVICLCKLESKYIVDVKRCNMIIYIYTQLKFILTSNHLILCFLIKLETHDGCH